MRSFDRPSVRRLTLLGVAAFAALLVLPGALATHGPDTEVTTGSNDAVMLQNKQNEPWVAINANDPTQIAAGANDNIDLEACNLGDDTTCPFTAGVGGSGVYFLKSDGSWTQPTYTGFSKRHCLGVAGVSNDTCQARTPSTTPPGEIGTLPWYFEAGITSDGDPSLAFGPKLGAGGFSWSHGARLYYANLTSNLFAERNEALKGFEGIAVSRTDNVAAAAGGGTAGKNAWMTPVVASKQSGAAFSDKESIVADDAASSPFFGNVYVCYTAFRSVGGAPNPIFVTRSTDGGSSWDQVQISEASNTGLGSGRQGCDVDTDSHGIVYVVWRGGDTPKDNPPFFDRGIFLSRSFDGGVSFDKPRQVARVQECGIPDPNQGRRTFDGVGGARTSLNPSLDVANGAPSGANAPDTLVLAWCDGPTPTTAAGAKEDALIQLSSDKGESWTTPVNAADTTAGDRPDFPSVAISPDGTDLYLAYMAFHAPWQSTTAAPRMMEGVVRHADLAGTVPGTFATIHRGETGDARGSSTNSLVAEFLGDYNYVAATNDFAYAVWNDVRNAADCPAVDAFRQKLAAGTTPNPRPAPQQACTPVGTKVFGNSDIFGTRVNDPT
jgi:hypothetical protein